MRKSAPASNGQAKPFGQSPGLVAQELAPGHPRSVRGPGLRLLPVEPPSLSRLVDKNETMMNDSRVARPQLHRSHVAPFCRRNMDDKVAINIPSFGGEGEWPRHRR